MGRFALLILLCLIIWGFWMTWEWLRKPKEKVPYSETVDILAELEELKKNNQEKQKRNEETI